MLFVPINIASPPFAMVASLKGPYQVASKENLSCN